ncbi:MAG: PEP-CTERM system histidine kinase PrsK, partial [Proteobacteria bacterium]|nr:PEP-CTERM system histidine kinase PrsK [Pseudomonadota bacterium]
MPPSMILWSYALAALLFGALALGQMRRQRGGLPAVPLVAALGATALWALAVAGIGSGDVATRLAEGLRNLVWLGFIYALARRDVRGGTRWLAALCLICVLVTVLAMTLGVAEAAAEQDSATALIDPARLTLRMLATLATLLLLYRIQASTARGGVRIVALALSLLFALDLPLQVDSWLGGERGAILSAARGLGTVAVALLFGAVLHRDGDG